MGTESAGMSGRGKWLAAVLLLAGAAPSIGSADAVTAVSSPLPDLITEALANNADVAAARSELEAARERVAPAGALEDPMLELGVINTPLPSLSLQREDMTMKMLGLGQKLPFPGKRELRRSMAALDADGVESAAFEITNGVVRDVRRV